MDTRLFLLCLLRHGNDVVDIRTRLSDQSFSLLLERAHLFLHILTIL